MRLQTKSSLEERLDLLLNTWSKDTRKLVPEPDLSRTNPTKIAQEINKLMTEGYDVVDNLMKEYISAIERDKSITSLYPIDKTMGAAKDSIIDLTKRWEQAYTYAQEHRLLANNQIDMSD